MYAAGAAGHGAAAGPPPGGGTGQSWGAPDGAGQAAPRPKRRRTRTPIASLAVLVLLIAGGALAVGVANATAHSPQRAVEAYLDALRGGDVDRANELADPRANSSERSALTKEVYDRAEHRITGYRVVDAHSSGSSATVRVEITQDEKTSTVELGAHRVANSALVLHNWELDEPLTSTVHVVVPTGVSKVTVNGVGVSPEFKPDEGDAKRIAADLVVLPGRYAVEVPPKSKFLGYGSAQTFDYAPGADAEDQGAGAEDGGNAALTFSDNFSQALIADADNEIQKHVDLCIKRKAFAAPRCPNQSLMASDGSSSYRDPHWTLTSRPTLEEPEYEGDGVGTISSKTPGKATLQYQYDSFGTWETKKEEVDIAFTVRVTVDGPEKFHFDWLARGAAG
ncbi:hypothetical protein BRM1_03205 [Brevibacterium sp. BRM-1]|uniref:hypothetical protein n=1 Tax=Brevibacterium sp. BRM-1 TaxID=2999062 RepID=UPI00227F05BD|nr:hypothetical protein [Brevibacterium sp. BRM-1]WAL40890.1 hypothetical protein BRM1_03205 [Brevibacterium sp. BRM-1]